MRTEERVRDALVRRARAVRVDPEEAWARIERHLKEGVSSQRPTRGTGPSRSRVVRNAGRGRWVAAAVALGMFGAAAILTWVAFWPRDIDYGDTAPPPDAVVITLLSPGEDPRNQGPLPSAAIEYGGVGGRLWYAGAAELTGWDLPEDFVISLPLFGFSRSIPPGATVVFAGDAQSVEARVEPEDGGPAVALPIRDGITRLPNQPGTYRLHVVGTWPEGTAGFVVEIDLQETEDQPSPDLPSSADAAPPADTASPTPVSSSAVLPCAYLEVEVSYLPWVPPGQIPGPPDRFFGPGEESATLLWPRTQDDDTDYVRITRQHPSIEGSGPGEPVHIALAGAPAGELYEGEAPGSAMIFWWTGQGVCSEIVLEMSAVRLGLTRAATREEILRVAESISAG